MASVQRQEVREWAVESSPVVEVEGVEKGYEEDSSTDLSAKEEEQEKPYVHEAENVKTSYDVEEDDQPSIVQKLKGKVIRAEDKLKPKEATETENADPHPALSPAGRGIHPKIHASAGGKKDEDDKPDALSSKDLLPQSRPPTEVGAFQTGGIKSVNCELGTGYEEDSEKETPTDSSDAELSSQDSASMFKPVQAKDESEQTLEELRASKLTQNSDADDVKAPGVLTRAKEEVEAVTDQLKEDLTLKPRRGNSGEVKPTNNQGGFFSRIAESIGYGGLARSRSR